MLTVLHFSQGSRYSVSLDFPGIRKALKYFQEFFLYYMHVRRVSFKWTLFQANDITMINREILRIIYFIILLPDFVNSLKILIP